ncbi:MAG: azurin [Verrucomicrobiota bacterium]
MRTVKFTHLKLALLGLALSLHPLNAQDEAGKTPDKPAEKKETTAEKTTPAEGEKKEEVKADVTVQITSNDLMQFSKKAFTVKAGQKVKVILKNIGKMPKVAMGHNLVLLKPGTDVTKFGLAAATAAPNYIPEANKKEIIAHTKMLGPGETDSILFTAPEAGKYEFICSFPGHFATMKGVMTVK